MTSPDPSVPLPPDDDPGASLRHQLAAAEGRWRLESFHRATRWLAGALAGVFITWALAAVVIPSTARFWPAGVLMALGAVALAAAECRLREPDWPRIRRRVDRLLGLPDTVLTAAELHEQHGAHSTSTTPEWVRRQLAHTLGTLRQVDWKQAWPVRASRHVLPCAAVCLLAVTFLGWRSAEWRESQRPPPPTERERDTAQALRAMFDDWDQSQREQPDEELKKLLADLQPLRDRLAKKDAALDEREAFQQLSRVEDKLAAIQAKLDAQSLQPLAADLAAALEKVDGLAALAAAMRRNDFENAEQHADKAAEQMRAPGAKTPQGAQAAEAADRLGKLSQQFGKQGNQGAQQSTSQMQSGLQKNQAAQMGEGLQGLKKNLAAQNARDAQKRGLSHQLKQMGMCKGGLCNGESLCKGMSLLPSLTMTRTKQPGHGAGSATDLNRTGPPTGLASDRTYENLSGTANDQGDSDTTNLSTVDPTGERTAAARTGNFQSYEQLSQQAVSDENIPLAHRQTIKRYFEAIRPAANEK